MKSAGIKKADINGLKKRFLEIIAEESQKWWADTLSVSQSSISGSWLSGNLPRAETLFRIMQIKGVSPTWLFFEFGPKYLKDYDQSAVDVLKTRETHQKIVEQELDNLELKERIKYLERCLKQQELSMLIPVLNQDGTDSKSSDDIFNDHILPIVTLMRLFQDILFKSFELALDDERMSNVLDWVKENFESGKFTSAATLKDLEKTFKKSRQ